MGRRRPRGTSRIFLLSPADCSGRRAQLLLSPEAVLPIARRLRSGGAPVGDVFSFLSGLYFRGKLAYARRFARPPSTQDPAAAGGALVITPNSGLLGADTPVTCSSLRAFAAAEIEVGNAVYRRPLEQAARTLLSAVGRDCEVVLLGSIVSGKYADVLLPVFGDRLMFPLQFVGRGGMSRGGLMLRCVAAGLELEYEPLAGAVRHGRRPPRLVPIRKPTELTMAAGRTGGAPTRQRAVTARLVLPADADSAMLVVGAREVRLTNLRKPFWRARAITKGDLLQYYADIAPVLLPHIRDRAMVMKRYPHGATGPFFFMKRAPTPRPAWIRTCAIEHGSGKVIDFPVIDDLPSLLWLVNLGCIDLNQWYARCDDVDRPDYVHFDLDPGEGATFDQVRECALIVREALGALRMRPLVKTSGSRGMHVYVPIVRGPVQKTVWTFAKALALALAARHPGLMTAEYRITRRPSRRVLVDYNQNRWGSTMASVYSVRPTPLASVSTPLTWEEVAAGVDAGDFRIDTVRGRIAERGDLWKPLLRPRGRVDLEGLLPARRAAR